MPLMRALRLTEPGRFEIVELERPHPGEGQVLLHVDAATICNQHDLRQWRGEARRYPCEPGFPGHEGAGTVVAVGPGVRGLAVGDRVVTSGIGGEPLYREYVLRRQEAVARVTGPSLPAAHLAPLELFGCARRALGHAGRLAQKRVGVVGLGPAGIAAVMLLRLEAPGEIVGIDLSAERRQRALSAGADRVLDGALFLGLHEAAGRRLSGESTAEDAELLRRAEELALEVVFDCTGSARALESSFLLARSELVIFGFVKEPGRFLQAAWFARELVIRNSKILTLDDLHAVARLTSWGLLTPGLLVTHVLPFHRYAEALELVAQGRALKVALVWDE